MRVLNYTFALFLLFALAACDPGLDGDLKIFNETDQTITIKFSNSPADAIDTVTENIAPGEHLLVNKIGGLGNKKDFDCCPARTQIFLIRSAAGPIKRDPTACENWSIPNKSKLRKFGRQPIKCEFHITAADL